MLQRAHPVVGEVIERSNEGDHACVLAILRLDALVGIGRVVLHIAQVEARLVPPGLLTCTMRVLACTSG